MYINPTSLRHAPNIAPTCYRITPTHVHIHRWGAGGPCMVRWGPVECLLTPKKPCCRGFGWVRKAALRRLVRSGGSGGIFIDTLHINRGKATTAGRVKDWDRTGLYGGSEMCSQGARPGWGRTQLLVGLPRQEVPGFGRCGRRCAKPVP